MLIEQTTLNGTTLVSFKQFINNFLNYPLVIPNNYQRDYKWAIPQTKTNKTALQVFLEDFYAGFTSGKYFVLGNIVCVASDASNKVFHLADGQQRITTMFIFLLEILKKDPEYLNRKSNSYLLNDDGKLWLRQSNEEWNSLFEDTLLSNTDEPFLNIANAQKIINDFINSCSDFKLEDWRDYLINNVKFNLQWIPLECEEEYFKDVNDKGVVLNTIDSLKMDILKNYPKDHGESLWCEFTLEINKFRNNPLSAKFVNIEQAVILHSLYFMGCAPDVTISQLKYLQQHPCNPLETAIGYLTQLNNTEDPYLEVLKWLKNTSFICCYVKLQMEGFSQEAAFKQCLKHGYSDIITSGQERAAFCRNITKPCNLKLIAEDKRFIYGTNKPNLKLVLFMIEAYLREGNWINNLLFLVQNYKDATLEHIQSQQFGGSDFLGNITLLTKSDNSKLNKLQEKYTIYKNSNFLITRSFCREYVPNKDTVRKNRAFYLPSVTSEELDRFNVENSKDRFEKINNFLNEILS